MSGFTLEKSTSNQSQKDWPKGVYIDRVKITKVENKESKWNDINLFIEAEDVSGRSKYPKKFFLGGKHLKDGDKFVGWGSTSKGVTGGSWKVRDFLIDAGIEKSTNMITEDGSLSDEIIADLHGREVFILQYDSNGKYSRETWYYFQSPENGDAIKDLLAKWNGFDDKPNKYLHSNKIEVQNKKLNNMWDNLPAGKSDTESELDSVLGG
tara:strand:+ start:14930 stop:15556 length:627 start_codon:yes stop_codon:yes gene_type:complete